MAVIVDLQGFRLKDNQFILKEFAYKTNDTTQVFLLKPPFAFSKLDKQETRNVRWLEINRGLKWNEGYYTYKQFLEIIQPFFYKKTIYVKGFEKIKWMHDILSLTKCCIFNIEDLGCPNFDELYKRYAANRYRNLCIFHRNVCAFKNVACIYDWCNNKNINLLV